MLTQNLCRNLQRIYLFLLIKEMICEGSAGVLAIGIGETLWREKKGKLVTNLMRNDIQTAGGCLQILTGIRSGKEAAIHATSETWQNISNELILDVDAGRRHFRKASIFFPPCTLFFKIIIRKQPDHTCLQILTTRILCFLMKDVHKGTQLEVSTQLEDCIQSWICHREAQVHTVLVKKAMRIRTNT